MSGAEPLEIRRTATFGLWLKRLKDARGRAAIEKRIERLGDGNLGDTASVGGGVAELRIHSGPGYRVYFARSGDRIILLLCAGDKASQPRDIERAKAMAKEL